MDQVYQDLWKCSNLVPCKLYWSYYSLGIFNLQTAVRSFPLISPCEFNIGFEALLVILSWGAHRRALVVRMVTLSGLSKSFLRLQSSRPFILQPLVVLQQCYHGLGLLPDVQALVLVVLHELEILQGLYCENVLLALLSNLNRKFSQWGFLWLSLSLPSHCQSLWDTPATRAPCKHVSNSSRDRSIFSRSSAWSQRMRPCCRWGLQSQTSACWRAPKGRYWWPPWLWPKQR